jgi:hypothetical protein
VNAVKKKYDWIVVGGGVSGVSVAEILCREGKSVLLLEKNEKLASETSKVFHEWLHSGALYSLAPDHMLTLRYLLGATDDLLEYYSTFPKMNLKPTEQGVRVENLGWFNNNRIEYRYRIHKLNPIWTSLVSRSINVIDLVSSHDWLRRKAGSEYGRSKIKFSFWLNRLQGQFKSRSKFFSKLSPDFTMNSQLLISDLLSAAMGNGLEIQTNASVTDIKESGSDTLVNTKSMTYRSNSVVICSPDAISRFLKIPIKVGYAPIAVVKNVPENESSFVELDYNIKKCINLLKKGKGIGQAGGITLDNEKDVPDYLSYVVNEHKKRNPELKVVDSYIGFKKELVQKGKSRNYLYHINQNSPRIWSVVLGKYTLAFSMAPEFYRRVYHENPTKIVNLTLPSGINELISEPAWQEIISKDK